MLSDFHWCTRSSAAAGQSGNSNCKAGVEQAAGDGTTALEHELGLGAHEECADLDQRRRGRKSIGHVPCLAQAGHEFAVRKRVRRSNVDGAIDLFVLNQEIDGACEVGFVNPGDVLPSVSLRAAQSHPNQI